jgi:pyridinium-3,5-bisthiocarboxylic acid mononucleotide nickel chelatase
MLLGALVDAGAPLTDVQAAVDAAVPDTVSLQVSPVTRAGLRASKVEVELLATHPPQRRWSDIEAMLAGARLAAPVRDMALSVFDRLARAEARVHGVPTAEVHFHEVGAWDSIADVVGVCAALHSLGVTSVSAGPVSLGSGRVRTAHGDLPVPVPAVLELSTGWQVSSGGQGELATPTGMALLRALANACQPLPQLVVTRVGMGAGTRDTQERANVVRAVIGERVPAAAGDGTRERLCVLEANVDDLDPRVWPHTLSELLRHGAADAWLTPILMKKGRPAHTLSVLCTQTRRDPLRQLVLELTSTFGVREYAVDRVALQRAWRAVQVRGSEVRIKVSLDGAGRVLHATPEFEDVAALAGAQQLPLRHVLDESAAAADAAGLKPGFLLPTA